MQQRILKHQGFTLIDLLITTSIVGVISMISVSSYNGYIDTTKNSQAASQIRSLAFLINDYAEDYGYYPNNLSDIGNENLKDPWGNFYVYLNLRSQSDDGDDEDGNKDQHDSHDDHHDSDDDKIDIGAARKDGSLVPINTKFDLCSIGKDGKTKPPLRAKESHDDIIYANDGAYIGLAESF